MSSGASEEQKWPLLAVTVCPFAPSPECGQYFKTLAGGVCTSRSAHLERSWKSCPLGRGREGGERESPVGIICLSQAAAVDTTAGGRTRNTGSNSVARHCRRPWREASFGHSRVAGGVCEARTARPRPPLPPAPRVPAAAPASGPQPCGDAAPRLSAPRRHAPRHTTGPPPVAIWQIPIPRRPPAPAGL